MAEFVFPLSALALVLCVLTPALTAVARQALARRRQTTAWADFGDGTTWAWLALPAAAPLLWLLSAALHQLEPAHAPAACRVEHVADACIDVMLLVGGIAVLVAFARRHGFVGVGPIRRMTGGPLARRLAEVVAETPGLRRWPIWLVDEATLPAVFTFGALRPVVAVRADFVESALAEDDIERLRAALLHEAAHAAGRDVLRQGLLRAALWLNPARRWLAADADRWRDAREAACDRQAVALGADPLALAQSLVQAVGKPRPGMATLCAHDGATLRLRITLLLDGIGPARGGRGGLLALALLTLALVAPHVGGEGLLDHFHHAVETWIGHG